MSSNPLKTIFQRQKSGRRNAFDLSYRNLLSTKAGLLTPFCVLDCNIGDHLSFSVNDEIRALNMSSYNFTRLRAHFNYFFVPYRLLWRWWLQFITGVNDNSSNLYPYNPDTGAKKFTIPSQVPLLDPANFVNNSIFNTEAADDLGYKAAANSARLLQLLGYDGDFYESLDTAEAGISSYPDIPKINPFRLLAYQKIYQDWFRNTNYENIDPQACNIDNYDGSEESIANYDGMFLMRYALYGLDRFTSLQPQINYIGNSGLNVDGSYIGGFFTGNPPQIVEDSTFSVTRLSSSPGNIGYLSLSSYRNAYAIEKMAMISQRAAKRYSSQMQAHWGEQGIRHDDNVSERIASVDHVIGINAVTSTSETSEGSLGQLGAVGTGYSNDNRFEYDCREHGVFMGIMYIEPIRDYAGSFTDPFNAKSHRGDYYQPEFDCLGMQPLLKGNVCTISEKVQDGGYNVVVGWQNRYIEYKSSVDVVQLYAKKAFPDWFATQYLSQALPQTSNPSLDGFDFFHINPSILDDVFLAKASDQISSDQFMISVMNSVQAVRNMSVDGTPLNLTHNKLT